MERQDRHRRQSRGSFRTHTVRFEPRVGALYGMDRVLEGRVVQLHYVGVLHPASFQAAGEVGVDYVEAAGAKVQVERGDVYDDLVALAHLAQQDLVGPGAASLAANLDFERVGGDDD